MTLDQFSDDAKIWLFGISPTPGPDQRASILERARRFLAGWRAHRALVPAAAEIVDDAFLLIAADADADVSGCAIDEMFGLVQSLQRETGLTFLDPSRVFYRDASGSVRVTTRSGFRDAGTPDTIVFDTAIERLGDLRNGSWQKCARDSWHARLLAVAQSRAS